MKDGMNHSLKVLLFLLLAEGSPVSLPATFDV